MTNEAKGGQLDTTSQTLSDHTAQNRHLFRQAQMGLTEGERLARASTELNTAQSYDDILSVLQSHTIIGQNAQHVNLNYFDRPWMADQRPEWVIVLTRWSQITTGEFSARYPLEHHEALENVLGPDRPALIADLANDSRLTEEFKQLYQNFGAKSVLMIPLAVGGNWIGFLNVIYTKTMRFPQAEVHLLMMLVGQAAVGVQNFYNLALAEQRASELVAINRVTQAISQQLEISQILETIYRELQHIMPIDAFFIGLYNDQTGLISYPLVYDQGECYEQDPVPLIPTGIIREVIETGEPVLVNRTPAEVETMVLSSERAMGNEKKVSASLLYVPLRQGTRSFGVISTQSYTFNAYYERERNLLLDVTSHVVVALENAHLFAQAEARVKQEQLVRTITDKIRTGADTEAILRITLQEISHMLGATKAVARLGTQAQLLMQHEWANKADKT